MPKKQKIKCIVDLGMTVLLLLLMAYTLVGEAAHEWLGMAMLVLFLLHHALNFKWLKNLPRGRYSGFRILQTVLAALILLTMLGSMVSGIRTSRLCVRLPASADRRLGTEHSFALRLLGVSC